MVIGFKGDGGRMTIDERIRCEREKAESWKSFRKKCEFNAECCECGTECKVEEIEHEQLAEWLEELKRLRQATEQDIYERAYAEGRDKGYSCGEFNGYNKAIDDFARWMKWEYENSIGIPQYEIDYANKMINKVTEQLKVGGSNE